MAAPGAAQDPAAGPLAGSLLAALAARGADDVVERHLAPATAGTVLVVCTYRVGSSVPVTRQEGVSGSEALQLMLGPGEQRGGCELIAHRDDGTELRVLVRLGDGPLVYQYADIPTSVPAVVEDGPATPAADLADAVREALADTTIEVDLGGIEEVVARAVSSALPAATATLAPAPALPPAGEPAGAEEIAATVERRVSAVVDDKLDALVRSRPALSPERGDVLVERLWLKVRGISHQLRTTSEALARVEAAVERVDPPGSLPSERLRDVVRHEVENLRAEVARLGAALSRFDGGDGIVFPVLPPAGARAGGGDRPRPGWRGQRGGPRAPEDEGTGPVPLAIVPGDNARR